MGNCMNPEREQRQHHESPVPVQQGRQIQEIDRVKAKLKQLRDRVDNVIGQYQTEVTLLDKEIEKEKAAGLKDKQKAIFLLKEKKEFIGRIANLQDRKKVVIKTLSDLAIQDIDRNMVNVLNESNQYMQQVQEELERNNWREVVAQAKNNNYQSPFTQMQTEPDPEVDQLYAELERQVVANQVANSIPRQQIPTANIIRPIGNYTQPQTQPIYHYN